MRRLGFADESFDGIWCCSAFLHILRREALLTLREFARILRPEGILYLDLKEGRGEEWKAEGNVRQRRRFFTYYSIDEIAQLLMKAGFEVLFSRRQEHARKKPGLSKPTWLNLISRKSHQ
jgi:predicted SAM-dependent methyltransferase